MGLSSTSSISTASVPESRLARVITLFSSVVIVTACELQTQIRRIIARDRVTEAEARQRIGAQLPIEEKVRRADYVIRTDGMVAETNAQVHAVYARLTAPVTRA